MSKALTRTTRAKKAISEWLYHRIFVIRNKKVMLSTHLAVLYQVEPRALIQAVKRNKDRFPPDFMFQLTTAEWEDLKSQSVISSSGHGGARHAPICFTEMGVAMLSSVLNSERAVMANISIMRTFASLRSDAETKAELARRIDELERRYSKHDGEIQAMFQVLRKMMAIPEKKQRRIGF